MKRIEDAIAKLKKLLGNTYDVLEKVEEDCTTAIQKASDLKKGILRGTMSKENQVAILNEIVEVLNGDKIQ